MTLADDVFSRRVRRVVIGVAIVSALATAAALLFGRRLAEPEARARDSYGRSAIGHRAFVETLEALGVHVVRQRDGRYAEIRAPLLFIEPDGPEAVLAGRTHRLSEIVRERRANGLATVLVLPKWDLLEKDVVVGRAPSAELRKLLRAAVDDETRLVRSRAANAERQKLVLAGPIGPRTIEIAEPQWLVGGESLLGSDGRALIVRLPGPVIVVGDPDFLHNFNLQRADHAALALDLAENVLATDTVVIDEVFHGHGEVPSLATALGRFPSLLLPLHALVLALLLLLAGMRRFGPALALPPALGRGPGEAIAVGAAVLSARQPAGRLAADYVERILMELGARLDGTPQQTASLAERIDALAERRGVTPRARSVHDSALSMFQRRVGARDALRLVRDAWTLRRDLLAFRPRQHEKENR